tara:strand:- start:287 stop:469 length:183 start_codon:yes stop_codon:yes gene_type:complete
MKLGDLVGFGEHTGIIVEDCTMLCSYGVDEPYIMGAMMVLVGGQLERIVYANLRLLSESR